MKSALLALIGVIVCAACMVGFVCAVPGNQYCGKGNVAQFPASDGPASLPKSCFYTGTDGTPSTGQLIATTAGDTLPSLLNKAKCGDVIELPVGQHYDVSGLHIAKQCDDQHWLQIRSGASDRALPAEGSRINPSYAGVASLPGRPAFSGGQQDEMAHFTVNGTGLSLRTSSHVRIGPGIEITKISGSNNPWTLIDATHADHIVLDRDWIHGDAASELTHGINGSDSSFIAVIDSYLNDFHCIASIGTCTDAQTFFAGCDTVTGASHTYKLVNNFLEASGEAVLSGGCGSVDVPYDFYVANNHFFKPMIWNPADPSFFGTTFVVKNHFELKNAAFVLAENNIFENVWGGFTQGGFAILFTPKNQSGACPVCAVHDVTLRYSVIHRAAGVLMDAVGLSDTGAAPSGGFMHSVHDLVADGLSYPTCYKCNNYQLQVAMVLLPPSSMPPLHGLRFDHWTMITHPTPILTSYGVLGGPYPAVMSNVAITNSIFGQGKYGLWSTGGLTNCATIGQSGGPKGRMDACLSPYTFASNVIIGGNNNFGPWPIGNFFSPDQNSVGFLNLASGDYHLSSTSLYAGKGLDGKDLGADIDAVNAAVANVQ